MSTARRALLALDLLGRQVGRGAHHAGGAGQGERPADPLRRLPAGQAEVGDHGADPVAAFDQHDVAGLQVAVDDAGLVGGVERVRDLADDGQRLLRGQRPGAPEPLRPGSRPAAAPWSGR